MINKNWFKYWLEIWKKHGGYGPKFGNGADTSVADNSNVSNSSSSDFGYSYYLPPGYSYGPANAKSFLAGTDKGWFTTEIEVFQIQISKF